MADPKNVGDYLRRGEVLVGWTAVSPVGFDYFRRLEPVPELNAVGGVVNQHAENLAATFTAALTNRTGKRHRVLLRSEHDADRGPGRRCTAGVLKHDPRDGGGLVGGVG